MKIEKIKIIKFYTGMLKQNYAVVILNNLYK